MAHEDIATVLTDHVESRQLIYEEAIAIAYAWLYENPKKLYSL
jgi:hypothetical protein